MNREQYFNWVVGICTAALYLLMSFWSGHWEFTWMIWIGYACYRFAQNAMEKQRSENQ